MAAKNEDTLEQTVYTAQDAVVAAEQMHRFLADATALKPYIETSQEAFNAYHTALNGMRIACQDYCRTLKEQGLMSR